MAATNGSIKPDMDAIVVGAGFAGLYSLYKLREAGFSARAFEAGGDVGGTWYWNRYPGARCDIESMFYSYQFDEELQQEWEWTERYSPQPEILAYANHVADRYDLRSFIQFDTRVMSAKWDDEAGLWTIETDQGDRVTARFFILGTGNLSSTNVPEIEGRDSFAGPVYHTGQWPHEEVDFTGQRVAVIGTGSSAIQSIPEIAKQAKHVSVFQRTANYTIPAWNHALDPDVVKDIKANYPAIRAKAQTFFSCNIIYPAGESALEADEATRAHDYEDKWQTGGLGFIVTYRDLLLSDESNQTAANFVRGKIRETVDDPAVAELLCPTNTIGCKRLCVDTDYYKTFNRENVELISVAETPIQEIIPEGVVVDGKTYEADAIVFATGFDAMTGAILKIDIRGREGLPIQDAWNSGPRTYLGLGVAGFPNMFTITGPGSPSVLANMIPAIEQHVDFILGGMTHLRDTGNGRIEAEPDAQSAWGEHVNEVADASIRATCNSWYVGANVPGKPRVFMPYIGGFPAYCEKCDAVAAGGYEGFAIS
jgi:cation diffusion facilitator CzcD-associated flavoprotein CzcO